MLIHRVAAPLVDSFRWIVVDDHGVAPKTNWVESEDVNPGKRAHTPFLPSLDPHVKMVS